MNAPRMRGREVMTLVIFPMSKMTSSGNMSFTLPFLYNGFLQRFSRNHQYPLYHNAHG